MRTKQLIIRVSFEEYQDLLKRKTRPSLATWIRETCLGVKSPKQPLKADPKLLVNLAKIGGNLNQVAKYINQNKTQENLIDSIKIINQLALIRYDLDVLLLWHLSQEESYAR